MLDTEDPNSRRPDLLGDLQGFRLAGTTLEGAQQVEFPAGQGSALLLVVGEIAGHCLENTSARAPRPPFGCGLSNSGNRRSTTQHKFPEKLLLGLVLYREPFLVPKT